MFSYCYRGYYHPSRVYPDELDVVRSSHSTNTHFGDKNEDVCHVAKWIIWYYISLSCIAPLLLILLQPADVIKCFTYSVIASFFYRFWQRYFKNINQHFVCKKIVSFVFCCSIRTMPQIVFCIDHYGCLLHGRVWKCRIDMILTQGKSY